MHRRFMCKLAVAFVTGITCACSCPRWIPIAGICLLGGLVWQNRKEQFKMRRIQKIVRSMLLLAFLCFGGFRFADAEEAFLKMDGIPPGTQIQLQGVIVKKEQKAEQCAYYLKRVQFRAGESVLRPGAVVVYWEHDRFPVGGRIFAQGKMEPLKEASNEGAFDQKRYQHSLGIHAVCYPEKMELLTAKSWMPGEVLYRQKCRIRDVYERTMDKKDAGVMSAMILGDKSLLEDRVKDLYGDAGISHIMAISGLHISILGMGVYRLLRKGRCGYVLSALAGGGTVCVFCIMSGMGMSSVRAGIMFGMFLGAEILGRSYDSFSALALAALFILWKNPYGIFHAGFLFSFFAVLGVVGIGRLLQGEEKGAGRKKREKWWKRRLCGMLETGKISMAAQLTTLPLTAYFYYEIPIYAVFVNVLILPFAGVLMICGILGGLTGSVGLPVCWGFLLPCQVILRFYQLICLMFGALPLSQWITGKPPLFLLGIYFAALLIAACRAVRKARVKSFWFPVLVLISLCLLPASRQFEINVLDVGQGDGIHISTREGRHFFIDGGSTSEKNLGTYQMLPYLKANRIRSIDGWFVSHGDADHISGLLEVLKEGYPVKTLYISRIMPKDKALEELLHLADANECSVVYLSEGQRLGTKSMTVTCLGMSRDTGDRNENSMVLSVEYRNVRALFTGDISTKQEDTLVQEYDLSDLTLLKAAHHGARTSNGERLLGEAQPVWTVISSGRNNRYGHPHQETMGRLRAVRSNVLNTQEYGQIKFRYRDGQLRAYGMHRRP